jgi:hypothetical protein
MKPVCQFEERGFPQTDCFFQASAGRWHGWNDEPFRPRPNLGRDYLVEAARERAKEMAVLGILLIAATWPIVLVIIEVARLYKSHR